MVWYSGIQRAEWAGRSKSCMTTGGPWVETRQQHSFARAETGSAARAVQVECSTLQQACSRNLEVTVEFDMHRSPCEQAEAAKIADTGKNVQ